MSVDEATAEALRRRVQGTVSERASLAPFTTFRVGGPADLLVEAASVDDLIAIAEVLGGGLPVTVVGRGSNLLVSDEGFRGVAIRLGRPFRSHEPTTEGLRFGGAVYLPAAARLTARLGLTGFEFASDIPATFGGAVRMNAGAHGRSMADVLGWAGIVDVATGERHRLSTDDLGYAYRHSALAPTHVVHEGEVRLSSADPDTVGALIAEYTDWRRENQPGGRSAGSVFKNPPGDSAGRLIEAAGLKGATFGGAEVSVRHANFIVVDKDARASDVLVLIRSIQAVVKQEFGVELEPEVRFVGEFPQVEPLRKGQLEG